jgi:acyl carrier protein
MSETLNSLKALVAEQFGKEVSELTAETTLESLGIDSLVQIELMFDLEDRFDVRFGNHQEPLKSLQEVADLIDLVRTPKAAG